MAAPANSTEFLDLVRKSGVADEKRLDAHLQRLRSASGIPAEAGKLAGLLVRDGLLTHFQAEQILQGKWKRFTLGKYKVLERLGSGGMGQVFLCEHKLMRRRVAVKVLPSAKAADASSLERFYREARAAAALDHPNIVHAYDIDQDETLHFLVMEYVDGASLQDIVKKSGPLEPIRAAHYIRQSALALDHAHKAGLVHRDIKPGNILVDRSGVVKVLDMGLARFFNDEDDMLTKKYDENVLGTADYLAPEQAIDSHSVDIRADIYGLGATFYFLLTGRTPFGEGSTAQKLIWHQTRRPRPISEIRRDVPAAMTAIMDRMMAKDPAQRYQTPAEVVDALAPLTLTPVAPPPEREMPQLSPAAVGASPGGMEPTQVSVQTTATPPSGPRKNWQVTGAAAPAKPSSSAENVIRPQVPALPTTQSPPPPRNLEAQATAALPVQVQSAPAPAPAPVLSPPEEAGEESMSWEEMTSDTDDPTAKLDTAPGSGVRTRPSSRRRSQAAAPEGRRFWRLAIVVLVVAVGLLVALGFALGWFSHLFGGRHDPNIRLPLKVSQKPGHGGYRTIYQALEAARPGDRIVLLDAEHREKVRLEGTKYQDIQIMPAPGLTVVWKAPTNVGDSILHIEGVAGVRIQGKITFDGEDRVEKLIRLGGSCPGVLLENVQLERFTKNALSIASCAGEANRPLEVRHLVVRAPAPGAESALLFSGNPKRPNAHMVFSDCKLDGAYLRALKEKGPREKAPPVEFRQLPGQGVQFMNVSPEVKVPAR
jgi:serine/threonine protein kinase